MRISRPCYDKMHRCPGWAGGGTRYAKVTRCEGGSLAATGLYARKLWKWRLNQCPECKVIVLPYITRWLDLGWWRWKWLDWAGYGQWKDWAITRIPRAARQLWLDIFGEMPLIGQFWLVMATLLLPFLIAGAVALLIIIRTR